MDVFWFLVLTIILPSGELGGEVISGHNSPEVCQLHAQSTRAHIEAKIKETGKKGVDVHFHCIAHPIPQDKVH